MKGDGIHMQHPLQPKNIDGLYSNNELANSLQFFLNVQRERHVDLGVMNYHCDNRYAI